VSMQPITVVGYMSLSMSSCMRVLGVAWPLTVIGVIRVNSVNSVIVFCNTP